MPKTSKVKGVSTHIPKFPVFRGKTVHELQNYIMKLTPHQLAIVDNLTETSSESRYYPAVALTDPEKALVDALDGFCWSGVLLARRMRELEGNTQLFAQLTRTINSSGLNSWKPNIDLALQTARPPSPKKSPSKSSEDEKKEVPVNVFELPQMDTWVL